MTLTEAFAELPAPRTAPAQRHDLAEMILMALCAVLCGADSWVDCAEWAEDNEAWLKRYDAIGCQTEISRKILDRGGDYLLAVKDNQVTLAQAVREFFADGDAGFGNLPGRRHQTVEKDHGRIETRQALWITDLSWLDKPLRAHWPKLAGVGMLERRRDINGTVSMERAFRIGSQGVTTAESFAKAARSP